MMGVHKLKELFSMLELKENESISIVDSYGEYLFSGTVKRFNRNCFLGSEFPDSDLSKYLDYLNRNVEQVEEISGKYKIWIQYRKERNQ